MCAYINVNARQMENNNKIVLIVEKKMGLDIEIIDYR
jgi:exopolyphosphatase/pppGpp-phosphohydrolase